MELSSYTVQALTRRRPLTPVSSYVSTSSQEHPSNAAESGHHHHHQQQQQQRSSEDGKISAAATTPSNPSKLKRNLNLTDIIFYGIGCSVGAGIYSLVGIGANLAGPSIAISFLLCGIACIFTSLCYAEFASRVPLAGSAYTFTYVSFGELCGWLVGWNLTLGYAISAAVVARSWSEYVVGFLQGLVKSNTYKQYLSYLTKLPIALQYSSTQNNNNNLQDDIDNSVNDGDDLSSAYTCCPLSMLIIGVCTIILVTGVKESTRFNTAMTILNLSVLGFVLLSGIGTWTVAADNLHPIFPQGVTGMAHGAGLVFFSYLGFDMVACLSEECIDPGRNMPVGIIGSLVASMSIYVCVSIVIVGMAPIQILGEDIPIVNALLANACCTHEQQIHSLSQQYVPDSTWDNGDGHSNNIHAHNFVNRCLDYALCRPNLLHPILYVGSRLVSFGAIFGLTTATFACLMGQPRINFAAAQDGLLFKIFAKVHPRTGVPTIGTIITGFLTAIIACFIDLEFLANAISLGTLQVFTFVNAGVILLRTRPSATTTITTPEDEVIDNDYDNQNNNMIDNTQNKSDNHHGVHSELSPLMSNKTCPTSPLVQDPEAEAVVRALGLIKESSREIRDLVRRSERSSMLLHPPPPASVHDNGSKPVWLVVVYTVSCVVGSLTLSSSMDRLTLTVCGVLMIVSTTLLFQLPKSPPPETFACPFIPTVPLMGILCNSYMMGSMPQATWLVISGWLLVGLLFYFGYGIHHSELKKLAKYRRQYSSRSDANGGTKRPTMASIPSSDEYNDDDETNGRSSLSLSPTETHVQNTNTALSAQQQPTSGNYNTIDSAGHTS